MFDTLMFIHLFFYPFATGLILAGALFCLYHKAWTLVALSLVSAFAMMNLCFIVLNNYAGLMQ